MQKRKNFSLFPAYCDKLIIFMTIGLVIFGSFMVISAEMGHAAGDTSIITSTALKQGLYSLIGMAGMFVLMRFRLVNLRLHFMWVLYYGVLVLLLATRLFSPVNGAYAWLWLGPFSVQPSEFAKVFIMVFGAKLLGHESPKNNIRNLKTFGLCAAVYVFVIIFIQKDFGSAFVLAGIAYIMALVPPYKEYTNIHLVMLLLVVAGLAGAAVLLSPIGTKILSKMSGNYMVGRFLASADPFAYQYDTGYHLIMGLVSFATGGWFGLGYGQSIHKYMNFPNPSTDFILPVIVEELGVIFGLLPILCAYGVIFYCLIKHSKASNYTAGKMILAGTFAYLAIHFVLNVGGVSGLIPLTGVPLLLISSGGSSLIATMAAIGISQEEIIKYRQERAENEDSSR